MGIPIELVGKATTDVSTAARVLSIGRNQAYAAVHSGEIKSFRIGGRIVIPVASLLRMLDLEDAPAA
jgi:excisionase family DNA binding protein